MTLDDVFRFAGTYVFPLFMPIAFVYLVADWTWHGNTGVRRKIEAARAKLDEDSEA